MQAYCPHNNLIYSAQNFKKNQDLKSIDRKKTDIHYDVPSTEHLTIEAYNIIGQKVITLVDEVKAPGRHEVIWNSKDENGRRIASGIYLYKIQAGDFRESKKMMLMK